MLAFFKILWPLVQPLLGDLLKMLIVTKRVEVTEKTDAQRVPSREVRTDRFDELLARRPAPRGMQPA